jgi:hypothetical protein
MPYFTNDILNFYEINNNTNWYLTKYFTNSGTMGLYSPYAKNVVANSPSGDSFMATVDENNVYEINSMGFRGEVYESSDVVGVGCSITFGLGIPESGRWTNILNNKINKNVLNLGSPGASVETMCNNIIRYCLNNKMPREIFCLFPDFFRNMVVVDKEFYKSRVKRKLHDNEELRSTFCNPQVHKDPQSDSVFMEIDDHKYIEDATSPHQLILNSINFIYILESFCLSNNIKLHWTTWDVASSLVMEKLVKIEDFKLKNFSFLLPINPTESLNFSIRRTCNSSHDSDFIGTKYWEQGSDYSIINYKKDESRAHPGVHFQNHVADFFYNLHNKKDQA